MYVDENGEFLGTLLDVASAVASAVDFVKKPSIKKAVALAVDVAAAVLPGVPSTGAVKVAKAAANVAKKAGDAISATKAAKTVVKATQTVAKTVKKAVTVAKGADTAADIGKAVDTAIDVATSTTAKKVVTETIENAGEAAVKADVIADTGKNLETAANAITSPAPTVVAETAQSVGEAVESNKAVTNTVNNAIDAAVKPIDNGSPSTVDRIRGVAQKSFDYAVNSPRKQGLNRMQLGKDAEIQATRWTRKWAERQGINLGDNGLHFQVRGSHSIPDVVYEPTKTIFDFKLTPKAVRARQSNNFKSDFPGYSIEYIFGPGPWR